MKDVISASDLVGCRYRLVQARAHPDIPRTASAQARAQRHAAARAAVMAKLPARPDNRRQQFKRIDLGPLPPEDPWLRAQQTLEALASGASHITGALLDGELPGGARWQVNVDLLLREDAGYTPVMVSNHRVARKHATRTLPGVPTHRVGLSQPLDLPYKIRHHVTDGYRLGLAARSLQNLGLDSGRGGLVGQDRDRVFFSDTQAYQPALSQALDAELPTGPRRVKECASCRFWALCKQELEAADEISLFLPGDRAQRFRERGIHTVAGLIGAGLGEPSELARAWCEGTVLLRRGEVHIPRADVEVDVDMEAYLDQGAYLWGALHEGTYHPFVTWEPLGSTAEAENFAAFWRWLMSVRDKAHAAGKTFAAYCYSAHGENHWLRMSAQRFDYPSLADVERFINSPEWVDMFAHVRRDFAGPYGLGLKVVAPQAGFSWRQDDFDGEESVNARRDALAGDEATRKALLTYNADDVRATRAVREWISKGAPGCPVLKSPQRRP